jgi:hypothetical protein
MFLSLAAHRHIQLLLASLLIIKKRNSAIPSSKELAI